MKDEVKVSLGCGGCLFFLTLAAAGIGGFVAIIILIVKWALS